MTTNVLFGLAPLVVFLPLFGLLLNLMFGNYWGEKTIGWVASLATTAAFVVSALLAVGLVSQPQGTVIPLANWFSMGVFEAHWAFQVDTLSVTMMLVVSGVGALIHIYSIGYMHDDVRHNGDPTRFRRFFVFMNLFIATMMILVSADNYLMMFVGWEGVGLCSYLLIGFWYDKGQAGIGNALAGKKAFVTNRIGDFGFLMAMFLIFWGFGTLEFTQMAERLPSILQPGQLPHWVLPAIGFFMLLAVTGKSAQLPLHVWLPDAMAGPTPVSALIHAATMVTAGVYLMTRSYLVFAISFSPEQLASLSAEAAKFVPLLSAGLDNLRLAVTVVGVATAFFAATIAVAQFDIKKVLAYSTISQLGFMVAAVGMGAYAAAMFHLVTHAFFKGLLFLSAGSVIQGMERGEHTAHEAHPDRPAPVRHGTERRHALDPQDMRNMGGLAGRMKWTFGVYLVGALALAGIPPLAGFWSKDEILLAAFAEPMLIYLTLTAAAFLTAFYMGRQVWLVFFGKPRSEAAAWASESPAVMLVPLVILAFLAVTAGGLNLPGVHTFSSWLEHSLPITHEAEIDIAWVPALVAGISIFFALLAIFLAWQVYGKRFPALQSRPVQHRPDDPLRLDLDFIFTFLENKWKVDELYHWLFIQPYTALSRFLAGPFEQRILDGAGHGLAWVAQKTAGGLRLLQTGYTRAYALAVIFGLVIILGYLILR